jgi:N-6 DNA Methylase
VLESLCVQIAVIPSIRTQVHDVSEKILARAKKPARRGRRGKDGSLPAGDDLERRRALGQFFTPIEVARFVWDMLELLNGRKLAKGARVIDPACGEGVFLHAALERDRRFAQYGADIDESLVSKWRSDATLKDAQFHLANGLVDDPALGLIPDSFDIAIGNPPFAGTGLKDLLRLLTARGRAKTIQLDLFDSTPHKQPTSDSPLLFPAERARLDCLVRELSRYDCWRLRHRSKDEIETGDPDEPQGIFEVESLSSNGATAETARDRAARTIAEWPQGRLLDVRQPDLRGAIQRLSKIPVEVYFVERFVRLAKPGGLVAMIVPDSILSSDQLGPLRTWLLEHVNLLGVVSLPQKVFTGVGAKARTGILIARRYTIEEQCRVDQTPATSAETRLPQEWLKRKVFMAMPSLRQPADEWNLEEYLEGVLGGVRTVLKQTGKESLPCQ